MMLEEKTRWRHVQGVLARPDFKDRVLALDPLRVSGRAIGVAQQLVSGSGDLSPLLRIADLGPFPAVIAAWTVAMLQVIGKSVAAEACTVCAGSGADVATS